MMRSPLSRVRQQILDDRIHRSSGGHQHHHRARLAEQSDELLNVCRAENIALLRFLAQGLDLGLVLVIARHRKAVVGHVQQEIASHDAQTDHADFILF